MTISAVLCSRAPLDSGEKSTPGIFHAVFGTMIGLLLWKLTEGKDGAKRFSLCLIFIYVFNNYIGPDFAAILWGIGSALQSDPVSMLGEAVHSYLGWVFWAVPWSIMWYGISLGFDRARSKASKASKVPDLAGSTGPARLDPRHSWADVFLAVLAGGLSHHFIDAIGHYRRSGSNYYVRGQFVLFVGENDILIVAQIILGIIVAVLALGWAIIKAKRQGKKPLSTLRDALDRRNVKAIVMAAIAACNVIVMYTVMASVNLATVRDGTIDWSSTEFQYISFNLGALQFATSEYPSGEATWWLVMGAIVLIVVFSIAHAKKLVIRCKQRTFRVDFLAMILFLAIMVTGYLLQPVIGNISGDEADFGNLIFTWSTLGTVLLSLLQARDMARSPTRPELASSGT
nr:DUF4184 family protein [Candidatus Sigynarchaeota archaeon]